MDSVIGVGSVVVILPRVQVTEKYHYKIGIITESVLDPISTRRRENNYEPELTGYKLLYKVNFSDDEIPSILLSWDTVKEYRERYEYDGWGKKIGVSNNAY